MRQLIIFYILLLVNISVFGQSKAIPTSSPSKRHSIHIDSLKTKIDVSGQIQKKMSFSLDTLTLSDFALGIERVNDNLISIGDSAKLGFDVVRMSGRIGVMTDDISLIRQNMRGRHSVFNIKNQFLYQRYTNKLEVETDQIQAKLNNLSRRVNHAKLHLNVALSDSVFRKLYADKILRITFKDKLVRLERKYQRTDSITSSNIDSLNAMKVRLSDNSYNLSNMLNIMDNKMDRAVPKLFGPEVNCLWEKEIILPPVKVSSRSIPISFIDSEKNAIGYYIRQTSGERNIIIILGILLFTWLFLKRKLLKTLVDQTETYDYLHFQYLNNHPILSLIVLLLCLMPFFDAYAPTSYISIVYLFLLAASSVILLKKGDRNFLFNWLALMVLFVADTLNYLLIEPTFAERILLN